MPVCMGRCQSAANIPYLVAIFPFQRIAVPCRYEVNPEMVPQLEAAGLMFVGKDETGERMEVVELQDNPTGHPFYAAAQVGMGY